MTNTVCSTTSLYHYLFNPSQEAVDSILENGIRPLSDFPESPRWQAIQAEMPGFFENLYGMMAKPVIQKPYRNSGIFITPIDFRRLPDSIMYAKPRFEIPVSRIDPGLAVLSYVIAEERISLPFSSENLEKSAAYWNAERVTRWFAVDNTKVFFYVPQVAVYQDVIPIEAEDLDGFPLTQ